jgi:hypothetical protein
MYQANKSQVQKESAHLIASPDAYYVELPYEVLDDQGKLLDSLILLIFDTLHMQHLDLRIVAEAHSRF